MDGGSQPINRSLQRRLFLWIAGIMIISSLAAGFASFYLAFHEAQELQDDQLRQVALLIHSSGVPPKNWADSSETDDDSEPDARIIVAELGNSTPSPRIPALPSTLAEGFQTFKSQGVAWRLFVITMASGKRIATGQMTAIRNVTARDSGLRTLIPMLLLVPSLALLVSWIIRRALAPVTELATQLDRRDDGNLRPIPETDVPSEIKPFVGAINRLMQRLDLALSQQRRFIADAAHELRSPLTALTVQAENLEQTRMSDEAKSRIQQLKSGLGRAAKLLEQLLNLSKSQNSTVAPAQNIRVDELVRQVVEEYLPFALSKQIDFGCKRFEPTNAAVPPEELRMLVRNAVDNALRYTPQGGTVDLSVYQDNGQLVFLVEDNGPGIQPDDAERIFEPVYRDLGSGETGSGLGLAIVRSIAERLGGTVNLTNRTEKKGVCFCYRQ